MAPLDSVPLVSLVANILEHARIDQVEAKDGWHSILFESRELEISVVQAPNLSLSVQIHEHRTKTMVRLWFSSNASLSSVQVCRRPILFAAGPDCDTHVPCHHSIPEWRTVELHLSK